jgi:hypothetical protein
MKDRVGKVRIYNGAGVSRSLVCDVLFIAEKTREHSTETCFPVPPACPSITYGVTEEAA